MDNDTEVQYIPLQTGSESDDLILPRDKFNSRFRYGIITRKCLVFYILSCTLVICACSIWIIIAGAQLIPILIFILCPVPMALLGVVIYHEGRNNWVNNVRINTQNTLSLLREVVRVKPGLDATKWDTIAARLNKIFYANDSAATPYFFYDGFECSTFFKTWYFGPSVRGRESGTATGSQLQPMVDEAVKVHEATLEEYWRHFLGPAESVHDVRGNEVENDATQVAF